MKKIAIISTSYYPNIWNGQGRSTFSTAYGLAQKGHDVSVFTFTEKAETFKQQDGQVTIYYIGGIVDPNANIKSLPFADIGLWNERMLPLLLCEKFDVLILNNWHGMEAAKKYQTAKIISFVPFLYTFTGWLKPLGFGLEADIKQREALFLLESDVLIAHTAKFAQKISNYSNRDVLVIPNCHLDLSTSNVSKPVAVVPNQLCAIGRVNRERSLERIIRVLPELNEVTLVVASPESSVSYFSSLSRLAKKFDVEHRIQFVGWQPTKVIRTLYRSSALAIVPSQFEPYGYGALDPMALGVPIIASEWSCLEDYLGGTEMIFSSLEQLAEKIKNALSTKTVNDKSITANKEAVASRLSVEHVSHLLDSIL